MTAEHISRMIKKVTGKTITARDILSTAASLLCKGSRGDKSGAKYFNSNEIEKILLFYEFDPEAFVGQG